MNALFSRRLRLSWLAMLAVAACAMTLAACGGDSDDGDSADSGSADTEQRESLKLASAAVVVEASAPFVAEAKGFFDDAGLDVEYSDNVGSNVGTMLASGQVDLAQSGVGTALILSKQGRQNSIIWNSLAGGPAGAIIGGEGVDSIEDLKGKRIAALAKGTGTYGTAAYYNDKYDLDAELVPLADFPTAAATVASGRVAGAVGTSSAYDALVENGDAKFLVDTRDVESREEYLGPDFPETGYFGLAETLDEKREAVVRFMEGVLRANEYMKTASDEEIAKDLRTLEVFKATPLDTLTTQVKGARSYWTPIGEGDGTFTEEDWDLALDRFSIWGLDGFDPEDPSVSYENIVDMSYVEEAKERLDSN